MACLFSRDSESVRLAQSNRSVAKPHEKFGVLYISSIPNALRRKVYYSTNTRYINKESIKKYYRFCHSVILFVN